MFNQILVALDTEETCECLFEEALALAQNTGAKLLLVGVLSPNGDGSLPAMAYPSIVGYPFAVPESAWDVFQKRYQAYKTRVFDRLCHFSNRAIAAGIETQILQDTGDPGQVVCQFAEAENVDLVIVGSHGRRGIDEFLMGSVSNYVMHRAHCSVLISRGTNGSKAVAVNAKFGKVTVDSTAPTSV